MSRKRNLKAGRFAALAGRFWRDPDRHLLSHSAQALYCAGLSYAADQMSDGVVPAYMIGALVGPCANASTNCGTSGNASGTYQTPQEELVGLGWWHENSSGFRAVGWDDYNLTSEEIKARSEKQRANVARRWAGEADTRTDTTGNAPPDPRPQTPEDQTPGAAAQPSRVPAREAAPPPPDETDSEPELEPPPDRLPTSAPPLRRRAPRDDLRAKLLAAYLEGYGNRFVGLPLSTSSPSVAKHMDDLAGLGATPETVRAAAEELARQRWWEGEGKQGHAPGLRHFVERFESYHVAASERSAGGAPRETAAEARERAQREYEAMHAGGAR